MESWSITQPSWVRVDWGADSVGVLEHGVMYDFTSDGKTRKVLSATSPEPTEMPMVSHGMYVIVLARRDKWVYVAAFAREDVNTPEGA